MAMTTAFFHDEKCLWHTAGEHALTLPVGGWVQPLAAGGHAESPESKRRLKALMDVSGLTGRLENRTAEPADDADLERVHDAGYLARFKELSDDRGGELGLSAPFGRGSYEIARLSAGLAKAAVAGVLSGEFQNAYSLSRPPGHHCLPDQGKGFCLLNNIGIAVEAAIAAGQVERVAVIDWDVHHGNGTEAIFYDRADVLTISLHQERCFPVDTGEAAARGTGAGAGFNLNIPLLPGGGHDAYLHAMRRIVLPAVTAYKPELIVVASGFDANGVDPLARMLLHSESYREMMRLVLALADDLCGGRVAVTHEGGYAESCVPFCGHAVIEAMSGQNTGVADPFLELFQAQQPNPRFAAFQRGLIDEMAAQFGM